MERDCLMGWSLSFVLRMKRMKKMKVIAGIWILCATFVVCTACASPDEKAVREAAYNYAYALASYHFDDAAPYATEETIATTISTAKTLMPLVDSAYIASDSPATIEITQVDFISDTSATVSYHKVTPIKDFNGTVELRRRDGSWLVHDPIETVER